MYVDAQSTNAKNITNTSVYSFLKEVNYDKDL